MINFFKRLFKTIKWLLNHPPIDTTQDPKLSKPCNYCGSTYGVNTYVGIYAICYKCEKKAFDAILKPEKKKKI